MNQGLCALVLSEFFGYEFAGPDVAFVQFRILLPLLRQAVQGKNCGHRADRYLSSAIDAFHQDQCRAGARCRMWGSRRNRSCSS
jgi:hypothetical protein